MNTFVDLYTRISGEPHIRLTVRCHGIGFEQLGHVETSTLGETNVIKIFNIKAQPNFWPEMISYRFGKTLCSYHYVESGITCNSGDVFKPMDIDVECLNLNPKWNMDHGGYKLSYDIRTTHDIYLYA